MHSFNISIRTADYLKRQKFINKLFHNSFLTNQKTLEPLID